MIRCKIDIMELLRDKGYNSTYLRNNKLLSEQTMTSLRRSYKDHEHINITTKTINTLCKLTNKPINYLFEYIKDNNDIL